MVRQAAGRRAARSADAQGALRLPSQSSVHCGKQLSSAHGMMGRSPIATEGRNAGSRSRSQSAGCGAQSMAR
jgi:hypothetical protein